MKKILIVKTSSLGDIIHIYPVLCYLKSKFPNCQIDWIVEKPFAELVKTHPYVSKTILINTGGWRKALISKKTFKEIYSVRQCLRETEYDCVFDLQGNSKSALFTLQARSRHKIGFARPAVFEWPNLLVTNHKFAPPKGFNAREEYMSVVQQYFQESAAYQETPVQLHINQEEECRIQNIIENQNRPIVLVCSGSAWRNKQMTEEALTRFLIKVQQHLQCHFLLAWGSKEECDSAMRLKGHFAEYAQLIDRLPLPTLQNLMNRVDLVIAMDSLPLHLAGTTKTATFSIFGASAANKFKPVGNQHFSYQGSCPYGRKFERRCPILRTCPTGACIQGLTGDEVFEAFLNQRSLQEFLKNSQRRR